MDENRVKSVTFLMPGGASHPVGGVKIAFEYANRLIGDGIDVHFMLPMSLLFERRSLKEKVRSIIRYPYNLITKKYLPYHWFNLDRGVKLHIVWSLEEHNAPKTDRYIATGVETSFYLAKYNNVKQRDKFYFIQHFEDWALPDKEVRESYRLPLNKIVIAKWLQKIVEEEGSSAQICENGFDFSEFVKSRDIEQRNKYCVGMLYHTVETKGCRDGIETLKILKNRYPNMRAILFSVYKAPKDLPSWIEFRFSPSKKELNMIYNEISIFMATSHIEGWGLTLGEAMACGAAVVSTDAGGYMEMAEDGITALVSPIKDSSAMAANVETLIEDDELRATVANGGYSNIQKFKLSEAYKKFRDIICS